MRDLLLWELGEQLSAEVGVEVAAADDDGYLLGWWEFMRVVEGGGEGDSAAWLGDDTGGGEHEAHGVEDLVLGDAEEAVDVREDVLEVEPAEGLGAQAVGDGAGGIGGGPLDEAAGVEGGFGVGGEGGFGSPDLDARVSELDCGGDAADQASSADRG